MVFGLDKLEPFYWKKPTDYRTLYDIQTVGYLDLAFCVIAVVSNAIIVAIFTKKHMISSANSIFTHIAVTESIAVISYLPRVWHEFFRGTHCAIPQHRTYHWELISFCSYVISIMFRNTGVWLAGMLAVWRYIAVLHPLYERDWCNIQITRKFIIAGYVFGFLTVVSLPKGLEVQATVKYLDAEGCMRWDGTNGTNTTIYEFQIPLENNPILYGAIAAYLSVLKTLPSVVLAIISGRLIVALKKARGRRDNMIRDSKTVRQNHQQRDQTTKILVVILTLFIIQEVPHGVFCFICAWQGSIFYWKYYYYWQEICTCLAHITESLNLLIYYTMSNQFRKNFRELFRRNAQKSINNITICSRIQPLCINTNFRPVIEQCDNGKAVVELDAFIINQVT